MVFLFVDHKEENMLDTIEQTILSALQLIFDKFGWFGVFALMIFENATGITPSEIILGFAGWMLIERHGIPASFVPLGGLYAGIGSAIGASIPYWIARRGGRPLVERFAKLFHIHLEYIEKIEGQCQKWGAGIVLVGRVIPGVRTLISIPAGLIRMPFPKFFLATFAGAYIWCTLLIGAGYVLGHEWHLISEYIKTHLPLVLLLGLLFVVAYLAYHYRASISIPEWIRRRNKELEP
jgi:membrane protein DedA with SNARE-associated domain